MVVYQGGFVLVRVVEVNIKLGAEECAVRLEILAGRTERTRFRLRFWRLESYRLQSTFPQDADGRPAHGLSDELILKEWESLPAPVIELEAPDVDAAEAHGLQTLESWLAGV